MADISVDPFIWSTTAGSNQPSGSTVIGSGLDDNLRALQAGVKMSLDPLSSVAGTNTITATAVGLTAYASGQTFEFTPANTNTGAATLNVTSLGAKSIFYNNAALGGGELRASVPVRVKYDGTQFQLMGAPANSSALVFISSASASNSATVDFTSGFTSAFDEYVIKVTDLVPATDGANLNLRISQAATFKSGALDYGWTQGGTTSAASSFANGSTGDTKMQIAASVSNANSTRNFRTDLQISNPAGTALSKTITWQGGYLSSSPSYISNIGFGSYTGGTSGTIAAAVDGVRFLMSAGNITSGNFVLYGVRKS